MGCKRRSAPGRVRLGGLRTETIIAQVPFAVTHETKCKPWTTKVNSFLSIAYKEFDKAAAKKCQLRRRLLWRLRPCQTSPIMVKNVAQILRTGLDQQDNSGLFCSRKAFVRFSDDLSVQSCVKFSDKCHRPARDQLGTAKNVKNRLLRSGSQPRRSRLPCGGSSVGGKKLAYGRDQPGKPEAAALRARATSSMCSRKVGSVPNSRFRSRAARLNSWQ
jgi:hypothetical protein